MPTDVKYLADCSVWIVHLSLAIYFFLSCKQKLKLISHLISVTINEPNEL